MMDFTQMLQNPPTEYRPVPFWSWNDKLEPAVLKEQISEMAKAGLGGYFMHARGGLKTEYLSEEWFDCIKAGIEAGEATGLRPWVYDEEGWPSGFAGGRVTALGEKYHAKGLRFFRTCSASEISEIQNLLGVYQKKGAGWEAVDPAGIEDGAEYVAVGYTSCPYYVDVMDAEVIAAFLKTTHEEYYHRYGKRFGKGLIGFFTDEPRLSEGDFPWSFIFAEEFEKRHGYSILPHLPSLAFETEESAAIRFDYWDTVSFLFTHAFMKQIGDWCGAHGCKLTGHMMMEESIYSQMTGTGGGMPFYEYMDLPGVDWLRRTMANPVMTKQVGSAAEQLGKKQVITESYALSGWDVSFEELKWIAEWQFVNGVNLMCQHLQGYTLRGLRKRDYPPSLFLQQTWWGEYKAFNDYLARLGMLLSGAPKSIHALVIHPMQSGWIAYDGSNNDTLQRLDSDLVSVCEQLSGSHIDYHFGDEILLERHGSVKEGRLQIGDYGYSTVILPPMLTLRSSTLSFLEKFTEGGGKVIALSPFPSLVNGRLSERLTSLFKKAVLPDSLTELSALCPREISLADENGEELSDLRCCILNYPGQRVVFINNLSKEKGYQTRIRLNGASALSLLDLESLRISRADEVLTFAPMQSRVLVEMEGAADTSGGEPSSPVQMISMDGLAFQVENCTENCLTLDFCEYSINGGSWRPKTATIRLMKLLLDQKELCDIALRFCFDVETLPKKSAKIVVEELEEFEITVNGALFHSAEIGWWKDSSFHTADVLPFLRTGKNEILLRRRFYQRQQVYDVLYGENVYETELNKLTYDTELESIYLIGDFGVYSKSDYRPEKRGALSSDGPFVLRKAPDRIDSGDLVPQGFAFFSGVITLGCDFTYEPGKKALLDLGRPHCAMLKVSVNGQEVKTVLWAPYLLDLTPFVQTGKNHLSITLYSSNRNLLGPHHHIGGELYNVGPASFAGEWSWCDRPTEAVASNPDDMGKDYWTDRYTFTEFGL